MTDLENKLRLILEEKEKLKPEIIKKDETAFGITGTYEGEGGWDTSQIKSCYNMFKNNTEITEAPYFNTSGATTMNSMFYGCSNLISVPKYDLTNVTSIQSIFRECVNLETAPDFDTSGVSDMTYVFYNCDKLIEVPKYNMSKATNISSMFYDCKLLQTVPDLNTDNATNFSYLFTGNIRMTDIGKINCDKANIMTSFIDNCSGVINFGGLINIGKNYTRQSNNYSYYRINFSSCSKLTYESLMNIINNLYDLNISYNVANGGTLYTQSLTLGSTNTAKLTAEEIAIATNKGWTVS